MIDEKAITDLIYLEAELLDTDAMAGLARSFHRGRYWMPLEWQQQDPVLQPSLMYEDLLLLKVRGRAARPASGTYSARSRRAVAIIFSRHRGIVRVDRDAGTAAARGVPHARPAVICWSAIRGWASHELLTEDGLKIKLKRVDLVNFDAPFGNIQLFM